MIYLNLIPSNMWYLNLRKILPNENWIKLSKITREQQGYKCYCCQIDSTKIPKNKFHCHEAWWFNDVKKEVSLKALLCVCELCHKSIHLGRSGDKESFKRIMNINNWDYYTTNIYVESEFETWSKRSNIKWKIDIDSFNQWLNKDDFQIVKNFFNDYDK